MFNVLATRKRDVKGRRLFNPLVELWHLSPSSAQISLTAYMLLSLYVDLDPTWDSRVDMPVVNGGVTKPRSGIIQCKTSLIYSPTTTRSLLYFEDSVKDSKKCAGGTEATV